MTAGEASSATTQTTFPVLGMSCAGCAATVEKTLSSIDGVDSAEVHLGPETVTIRWHASAVSRQTLADQLARSGYRLILEEDGGLAVTDELESARRELDRLDTRRFLVGVVLTVPLFVLSMGNDLGWLRGGGLAAFASRVGFLWLLFALATPVQFYTGGSFYRGAWRSLRTGTANMDVLVSLGSSVAFFYSLAVLLELTLARNGALGQHVYFETAAVIITLVKLGKLLEARARSRTSRALEGLLDLAPSVTTVLVGGREIERRVSLVEPGDRVVVRPGENVPVDGVIQWGESAVDESLLTGESIPVDKQKGSAVFAGTVNVSGMLHIDTTSVGSESALGRIIRLVREAQSSRPPIQRVADRIASWFVPAMVIAGLSTFVVWWILSGDPVRALLRLVAVLVIACPCALGLATPTAIVAGLGRAAASGILFRDSAALERVQRARIMLFDKTGTLTVGRPELVDVVSLSEDGNESWLRMAATVEAGSRHPLAESLCRAVVERGMPTTTLRDFVDHAGDGVAGLVGDHRVRVGKPNWILGPSDTMATTLVGELAGAGKTVVAVEVDSAARGLLAFADRERDDARQTLDQLRALGVEPVLLTGDNSETAAAVAGRLGIEQVRSRVLPEEKAAVVRELQGQNRTVAMVGDGVNDAPALAAADVGIAMGTGADVAKEAADVTLIHGRLPDLVRAVHLSRATMRTIRENLFWAFVYNLLLVPVAAGVLAPFEAVPEFLRELHPGLAALAMAFSSVTVVLNSLRLQSARF